MCSGVLLPCCQTLRHLCAKQFCYMCLEAQPNFVMVHSLRNKPNKLQFRKTNDATDKKLRQIFPLEAEVLLQDNST